MGDKTIQIDTVRILLHPIIMLVLAVLSLSYFVFDCMVLFVVPRRLISRCRIGFIYTGAPVITSAVKRMITNEKSRKKRRKGLCKKSDVLLRLCRDVLNGMKDWWVSGPVRGEPFCCVAEKTNISLKEQGQGQSIYQHRRNNIFAHSIISLRMESACV